MTWQPIATYNLGDAALPIPKVDLWMEVAASPRSMGWADSFRVTDCWRDSGRWMHFHNGKQAELDADYITHWMPIPAPPTGPGDQNG